MTSAPVLAYLGVGSNIGNREETIASAIELLQGEPAIQVTNQSRLYVTEPMYLTEQPEFLNGVVEIETTLSAVELLSRIQRIESQLGRTREVVNGPRTLDLDLLIFGEHQIRTETLHVPHPRLAVRAFVLVPLCEIASQFRVPGMDRTVYDMLVDLAFPGAIHAAGTTEER